MRSAKRYACFPSTEKIFQLGPRLHCAIQNSTLWMLLYYSMRDSTKTIWDKPRNLSNKLTAAQLVRASRCEASCIVKPLVWASCEFFKKNLHTGSLKYSGLGPGTWAGLVSLKMGSRRSHHIVNSVWPKYLNSTALQGDASVWGLLQPGQGRASYKNAVRAILPPPVEFFFNNGLSNIYSHEKFNQHSYNILVVNLTQLCQ
jgi:hypothetical protein